MGYLLEHLPVVIALAALVIAATALVLLWVMNGNRKSKIEEVERTVSTIEKRLDNSRGRRSESEQVQQSHAIAQAIESARRQGEAGAAKAGDLQENINNIWAEINLLGDQIEEFRNWKREQESTGARHSYPVGASVTDVDGADSSTWGHGSPPQQSVGTAPTKTLSEPERAIVWAYNEASNSDDRSPFLNQYPTDRLDVVNANDLARDPTTDPEFKTTGTGDYLLLKQVLSPNLHAVVPKFGLIYTYDLHTRAAMGQVFSSEGVEEGRRYRDVRLVAPALFRGLGDGTYELEQQGAIELGQGE